MSFGLGAAELLCLGVFFMLCLGVAGLFLWLQIKRHAAATSAAANHPAGPPAKPMPADPTPHSSFAPLSSEASVAAVARIAERFCPACRGPLERDAPEGLCPACLLAGGIASEFAEPPDGGFAATTPPGQPSEPADHDMAGLQEKFPQLEILELLGRGGMGSVYKVRQRNLDRVVALKVIPPASARDPEFAERFAREARALARLNHPNIVTVYDFGQTGDVYYLLMEYVDGVNLRHTLRAGNLQPEEALAVVPQICDALQYAHDQGVVHRDIKPENVLLDRSGRIKIADFGLAKLLGLAADDFHLTRTQQVMGTPRYMAPEQIERPSQVDHRADIYSLGVVIYEMLTGELPVGRFALPSQKSSVDPRVDQVVLRSLEKEPELRYQRASQVKLELASVSSAMREPAEWSGPRFPTPAPVYRDPKPPHEASEMAAAWLPMLLLLAGGMVVGCLMITAGLAGLAVALFSLDPGSQQFGGWLGAAFGFICGGGGALVGSYNSYRQLAGAEDLLRTPHITWFDWVMRVYLVIGVLLVSASFLSIRAIGALPLTHPTFFLVGGIMLAQGALFALIRSLMPPREIDSRYASGGNMSPSLWRAAGVPAAVMAGVWLIVLLDVMYATPIIAPDERGSQWLTYLFYQRWQVANWALGIGVVPLCFGVLASCRALAQRAMARGSQAAAYPFEHPGWILAVALLGFSTAVLPWARLDHVSQQQSVSVEINDDGGRDFSGIDMARIAGLRGTFRFVSRDVVGKRLGLVLLLAAALALLALLPISARIRGLATLGFGLVMLAVAVTALHEMADQPASFILDQRTVAGINTFLEKLGGGNVDPLQWSSPLSEVIAVRPALGLYALVAASLLAIFLGASGASWQSGAAEQPQPATQAMPIEKAAPQFPASPSPAALAREKALAQVRGPAMGLMVTGFLGLTLTAMLLLLSVILAPAATVTGMASDATARRMAATAIGCSDASGALVTAGFAQPLQRLHPTRLAQAMHDYERERMAKRAHDNWVTMLIVPTVFTTVLTMPFSILFVVASVRMRRLESYHFSLGVAMLACVPCTPVWLLGLPMGLWAISVLLRPEVKAAFDQPAA